MAKLVLMINPGGVGCRYRPLVGREALEKRTCKLLCKCRGFVMLQYGKDLPIVVTKGQLRAWYEPIMTRAVTR